MPTQWPGFGWKVDDLIEGWQRRTYSQRGMAGLKASPLSWCQTGCRGSARAGWHKEFTSRHCSRQENAVSALEQMTPSVWGLTVSFSVFLVSIAEVIHQLPECSNLSVWHKQVKLAFFVAFTTLQWLLLTLILEFWLIMELTKCHKSILFVTGVTEDQRVPVNFIKKLWLRKEKDLLALLCKEEHF